MKKLVIVALVLATGLISCKGEKKEKVEVREKVETKKVVAKNNVDVATSVLNWKGTKASGEFHTGTVSFGESTLVLEDGKLTSGEFVIDMSTIKNTDIKSPKYAAKLVGHLSNADFFDVTKFSTSKFVITSVKENGDKLDVTGNLTIKDVTKSITIPATVSTADGVTTFKSDSFNVNRADFNVKYGSKSFFDNLKDKFINDLVEFSFEVKAKS